MTQANILLEAERAAVLLHETTSNSLVFAAVAASDAEKLLGRKLPVTAGIAGWAIRNRQAILVNDTQNDPRFYGDIDAITGLTTSSLLVVPIIVKDRVFGVVEVTNKVAEDFNKADLKMLEALTNSATIAIENARLFGEVQTGREQLRQLTQRIVTTQEEERQRLSRELHDEAGQALTALKIELQLVRVDLPPEATGLYDQLNEAIELTDTTMEQLRSLARGLRPPGLDTAGLTPTLEGLCRDFGRRTQLSIDYTTHGSEPSSLVDPVGPPTIPL